MNEVIAFTTARLIALKCPAGAKRSYARDSRLPSLYLQITSNGVKTFYLVRKLNGRTARIQIGRFPAVTIDTARKEAARLNGEIVKGIDPRATRRELRSGMTLGELFDDYLELHAKPKKASWKDDEAQFKRYLQSWRPRALADIQRHHIAGLHSKIGKEHGHYAANRLVAMLSKMFGWARKNRGYKGDNPAEEIDRFQEEKRDRFLQPAEMARFFRAVESEPNEVVRDFILTALYTGQRRSNVSGMAWAELDLAGALWRIPRTKNGKPVFVPLCAPALEILNRRHTAQNGSPFVFPSWGKSGHLEEPKSAWKSILKRAGITDLRLHDLRRTFGSWQAVGGSSLPVIGKSLGHASTAATEIYARLHLDAVRQSINAAVAAIVDAGKKESGQ